MKRWLENINNAVEGILHSAKTQRHLRYHLYSATIVLLFSYIVGVNRTDFLIISIVVILVLLAEMVNTAIEFLVDMVCPEYNEKARAIKDTSAGAVLITAFGAAIVGYIVLFPYLNNIFQKGLRIAKHSKEEITLLSLIVVLILVIILKAYFGKGHPLRGGMPSGHSAIAFSVSSSMTFITQSFNIAIISFLLALLIAQSRVIIKAHTIQEVLVGALIGISVTTVMFLLFK